MFSFIFLYLWARCCFRTFVGLHVFYHFSFSLSHFLRPPPLFWLLIKIAAKLWTFLFSTACKFLSSDGSGSLPRPDSAVYQKTAFSLAKMAKMCKFRLAAWPSNWSFPPGNEKKKESGWKKSKEKNTERVMGPQQMNCEGNSRKNAFYCYPIKPIGCIVGHAWVNPHRTKAHSLRFFNNFPIPEATENLCATLANRRELRNIFVSFFFFSFFGGRGSTFVLFCGSSNCLPMEFMRGLWNFRGPLFIAVSFSFRNINSITMRVNGNDTTIGRLSEGHLIGGGLDWGDFNWRTISYYYYHRYH